MAIAVSPNFYDQAQNYPLPRVGQQTVGTTPLLVVAYNPKRLGAVVTNTGTTTVYLGPDMSVSTTSGHALMSGNSLSLNTPCELWGVCGTGTNLVTTFEEQVR